MTIKELKEFYTIDNYETFDKYIIQRFINQNGKIAYKIFNTNAKKIYKAQVQYYTFRNEEQREQYIQQFKKEKQEVIKWKEDRKISKSFTDNPAKIGDILYSSWGYDQTNIDFYQVTEVKGKSVIIRSIRQERKSTLDMQGTCMPIKDNFIEQEKPLLKRVRKNGNSYDVNLTSYSSAWLWDGIEKYWTAYA